MAPLKAKHKVPDPTGLNEVQEAAVVVAAAAQRTLMGALA